MNAQGPRSTPPGSLIPSLGSKARAALDAALAGVVDAKQIVGHPSSITPQIEAWAEKNGLDILPSRFTPMGRLYITGAVQVDDSWLSRGE